MGVRSFAHSKLPVAINTPIVTSKIRSSSVVTPDVQGSTNIPGSDGLSKEHHRLPIRHRIRMDKKSHCTAPKLWYTFYLGYKCTGSMRAENYGTTVYLSVRNVENHTSATPRRATGPVVCVSEFAQCSGGVRLGLGAGAGLQLKWPSMKVRDRDRSFIKKERKQ
ncbi:hypothetical protein M422DRAFT_41968 [Sphaerobolus stellatus SS14]|nr:hypothetical protein M422DRAFT_41968 [Sphaerobolus stellatus SS14]